MLESAEIADGKPHTSRGSGRTIMAGLNCATPSMIAWPVIMSAFDAFAAVDDVWAEKAMRVLAKPTPSDPSVTSGESGAAGMAALLALTSDEVPRDVRKSMRLTKSSRVLIINTEGATDPEGYARVIHNQS
jgi:diaminopropionate ammonia-lyase